MRWEQTGDGQVHTSVRDLALWDANFYAPRVGDRAIIDEMQRSGVLHDGHAVGYGGGLFLSTRHGLTTVSHGGGWAGYRSELLRFPERQLSVIVLSNRDDVDACALAQKVAQDRSRPARGGAVAAACRTSSPFAEVPLIGRPKRARIAGNTASMSASWRTNEGLRLPGAMASTRSRSGLTALLQFTAGGDVFLAVSHVAADGRLHFSVQLDEEVADYVAVETGQPMWRTMPAAT